MSINTAKPMVAVVCPTVWDVDELTRLSTRVGVDFQSFGGHLHSGTNWAQAAASRIRLQDPSRFVRSVARACEVRHVAGIFSTDDDIGAALAAAIATRLGLPSASTPSILRAQHKHICRSITAGVDPAATPRFTLLSDVVQPADLDYPVFVKPLRGTLSVLAGVANSPRDLSRMTKLGALQRIVWHRRMRPFQRMFETHHDGGFEPDNFLLEQVVTGRHLSVEGYCRAGEATILGIVEAQMYEGTISFKRFDYPAAITGSVSARASALASAIVERVGLRDALFEVEMLFDESVDQLWVIEVNPRMCAQFSDLFEKVTGQNLYDVQLALCLGERIRPSGPGQYHLATSYVFRSFARHDVLRMPSTERLESASTTYPDARIRIFKPHHFGGVGRVIEDRVSDRIAVVNVGGNTREELDTTVSGVVREIGLQFSRSSRVHRELIPQE